MSNPGAIRTADPAEQTFGKHERRGPGRPVAQRHRHGGARSGVRGRGRQRRRHRHDEPRPGTRLWD
jgi:hypothetical protein